MQSVARPFFTKGRILKKEALYLMSDYPRDVLDAFCEDLSDGIVCGLTPSVDKDVITFSKGITKYNGRLYVLNSPTNLAYKESEAEVSIKLCFYDEVRDNDYLTQYFEIETDPDLKLSDSQQELGRFKLKKGAYLRSHYQSLDDFTTEYNTINLINVLYAGTGEPTINNQLLKYFAKEALDTGTQNPLDIAFCMMCLNNTRMERMAVEAYITRRLEESGKKMDNGELHKGLVQALARIKRENIKSARGRAEAKRIMVD